MIEISYDGVHKLLMLIVLRRLLFVGNPILRTGVCLQHAACMMLTRAVLEFGLQSLWFTSGTGTGLQNAPSAASASVKLYELDRWSSQLWLPL